MQKYDLTTGPIKQALLRIAVPASIGFLFNTLFNVVDTYFAGSLSLEALAGLTVSFPIFFILIALASGIGTGSTALAGYHLGRKDIASYHQLAKNAIILSIFVALVLVAFTPSVIPWLLRLAGAQDLVFQYGLDYMNVIIYGAVFQILNFTFNGLLSAQGNSKPFRNFLIVGFFLNLILDPMFIFGWFGLPRLETAGVAVATVIVQALGTVYLAWSFFRSKIYQPALFKQGKLNRQTMKELINQGLPVSLNNATVSIGIFIIQFFIFRYGNNATIAGYGAAIRIEQIALLPTIGINIATIALVSQNFGANAWDRIEESIKYAVRFAMIVLAIGLVIIFPLAPWLVGLFNQDPAVIEAGTLYLRIEGLAIFSYSLIGIASSTLQAIKKPYYAFLVGLIRQLSPLLVFYVFAEVLGLGVGGIWWGIVVVNYLAVILAWTLASSLLKSTKLRKIKS
jgi:putative MATE family efflux protein